MNRNQKEAMIAGIELAERAHAAEMAQAVTLLKDALNIVRTTAEMGRILQLPKEAADVDALAARIEEFLK